MKNSFLSVLKFPNFKYMWLSQIFSQIALNMLTFALILHLYEITGRATSISLVMIATAIPIALFGPISGVMADKINYKKILIYTNLFRFIVAILLLFAKENILAYLEIIFLISALSQIFIPAESSSVPLVVPQNKLLSANSLIMTTSYATLLIGYSVAGPLLDYFGSNWLFFTCAILYLIATWSTYKMSEYDTKQSKKLSLENLARGIDRVWEEVVFGFTYLKENKLILDPMIKLTIGWVVLGAFITLIPAYGDTVLKINPKYIGPIIIGPASLGMLYAIWFLGKRTSLNYNTIINKGFIIFSVGILLFSTYSFYHSLPFSFLIMILMLVLMGIGSSLVQVSSQTLLHLNSAEDQRGKVFGLSSMQLRLAITLPALVIGGVSDVTSPLVTMLLLATTVFIYSLILQFE